jgi:hypothetical protein
LGVFCTVDREGKTRIIAASFQLNEDDESFSWIYEQFIKCFGSAPNVLWTDEDAAMASAAKRIFPDCHHHLCIWHLYKNFYKNLHPLFIGKKDEWSEAQNLFWKMAKNTDQSYESELILDLEKLRTIIDTCGNSTALATNDKSNWYKKLVQNKERWAGVYTYKYFNAGLASTQRVEAINSAVALFCSKKILWK